MIGDSNDNNDDGDAYSRGMMGSFQLFFNSRGCQHVSLIFCRMFALFS